MRGEPAQSQQQQNQTWRSAGMDFVTMHGQRERMETLLRGDEPEAVVALLVGFYTVELRNALEAMGIEVITCDYRLPESDGMHYQGDVREILYCRVWTILVGCPPCRNLTWATTCLYEEKRESGEQWWSLAFFVLLYTAPALHIFLEHPGNCVADFLRPPDIMLHPKDLAGGNGVQKLTFLWAINMSLVDLEARVWFSGALLSGARDRVGAEAGARAASHMAKGGRT